MSTGAHKAVRMRPNDSCVVYTCSRRDPSPSEDRLDVETMHGLTFHGRPSTRRPAITMHVVTCKTSRDQAGWSAHRVHSRRLWEAPQLVLAAPTQSWEWVPPCRSLGRRSQVRKTAQAFSARHHLTTSFGRFYPPTDLVAAATAAAPYGLCMIWCRTALSRSNAEVRNAVKMRVATTMRDHGQHQTCITMHHTKWRPARRSSRAVRPDGRSRPSATQPGSIPRRGKRVK